MYRNNNTAGRLVRTAAGLGLVLLAAGCSSRGTVTGKVVYQSKPLPGGKVVFIGPKGAFTGAVGPDGSYQVANVPTGPVKIAVVGPPSPGEAANHPSLRLKKLPKNIDTEKVRKSLPPEVDEKGMRQMMGLPDAKPPAPRASIPTKYSDPEKSGLTCTVTGGPQTHDITLQD
jgi:hypothetical protein